MKLSVGQVADKLGVSDSVVLRMVRDGVLKPCNEPKEGAKKFFRKFESSHVNEVKKELAPARVARTRKHVPEIGNRRASLPVPPVNAQGMLSIINVLSDKVDALGEKLDYLIALWV